MIRFIKEYRTTIFLFLFLLIPIIAIDTNTRAPRDYRPYDRWIIGLTAPIQTTITWTLDQIVSAFENYVYLLNTRSENQKLLQENRKLLGSVAALRETEQENIRLRRLLDFRETYRLETVVARVIAKDVSSEFRALRINRGENAGIQPNMAVITPEGVVGRVLRTTSDTADIVTILDLLSAVDAISERTRARGIVEGLTDETCELKYALRTDDIRNGDRLVTSGLGGIFPKGIPLGSVIRVNRKSFGISQEVEIEPAVEFSQLEEVAVVTNVHQEKLAP
jgi:rod shape-determining protein MreC